MVKRKSVYDPFHRNVKKKVDDIRRGEGNFEYYNELGRSASIDLQNQRFDEALEKGMTVAAYYELNKAILLETAVDVYMKKKRYDEALKASKEIINAAPEIVSGYALCGRILGFQGYHKEAIKIYNKALENLPDLDADRRIILDLKKESYDKLKERKDPFAFLPRDVAHQIIDNLDLYTGGLACLDVSKHWRQILGEHPSIWSEIDITTERLQGFDMFRLVQIVGTNVRHLQVSGLEFEVVQQLTDAAINRQIVNVRHLSIEECVMNQYQLLQILAVCGGSLIELKLHITNANGESLPIEMIFNMCPHLESFNYQINEGAMQHHQSDDMQHREATYRRATTSRRMTTYRIRTMILEANYIPLQVLDNTLRLCPHLQTLQIRHCDDRALRSILTHSHYLLNLGVNGFIPLSTNRSTTDEHAVGLRNLGLHYIANMRPADVIEMLERSQTTLETATLVLQNENNHDQQVWSRLRNIRPWQLKELTYTARSQHTHENVASMMEGCVDLESMTFIRVTNLFGTLFEQALLSLQHLRVFKLYDIQAVNVEGLRHFFQEHARRENGSSLRKVSFNQCGGMTDDILESLSHVVTLEDFQLTDCTGTISQQGLLTFARTLADANRLEHIRLEQMPGVSDEVLWEFAKVSTLRTMHLSHLPNITPDAVEEIARERLNLEKLDITFCRLIGHYTIISIKRRLARRR